MNKIIIQNNKTCQVDLSDNPEIIGELRQYLSFKMTGVEYTQAFKNGWDGITFCLNKNGTFPLGLFFKVQRFLDKQQIPFEIIDKRKPVEVNVEMNIADNLQVLGMTPRDYQLAVVEATATHRKGIVRASTGSGKTLIAALIAAKHNKPTIIYVIGLDLLQQFHTLFTEVFKQPIGFIGNGVCEIQRINIASIWTIGKALDLNFKMFDEEDFDKKENFNALNKFNIQQLLKSTQLHIFDECHSVACDTIKAIYKAIDPIHIYGMSATPYRDDGSDLLVDGMLGEQIINVSASSLIKKGILAQPIIKFVDVPAVAINSRTYASVYSEYIVENDLRNTLVVLEAKKLIAKGYQTLILFKQIKHGKLLKELLREHNIECAILDGRNSLEERNEIKKQLLAKQINVVLASTIYDLGIDVPTLSGLVLAGGGNSSIRAMQRIGRVIRGGKKLAAIVDFYDQARFVKNHSMARYKCYAQEDGFHIIPSNLMKKAMHI